MQDTFTTSPVINIHSLANSWLSFSNAQKEKMFETLRQVLLGTDADDKVKGSSKRQDESTEFLKQINVKKDCFFYEQQRYLSMQQEMVITPQQMDQIVDISQKLTTAKSSSKKKKKAASKN